MKTSERYFLDSCASGNVFTNKAEIHRTCLSPQLWFVAWTMIKSILQSIVRDNVCLVNHEPLCSIAYVAVPTKPV